MVSKALRMNASSSPRGTVKPAGPKMKKTASSPPGPPSTPRVFQRRMQVSTNVEDSKKRKKYIHVHHFKQTSLFGAWFNDPSKPGKKQRLFFGSHLTAYLAARAQDRAALKYKPFALDPKNIKLNFKEEDYVADEELRKMLTCEEFGELLRKESRPKYTKMEPTPCLRHFLAEEKAQGNLSDEIQENAKDIIPLKQYLQIVFLKREEAGEAPAIFSSDESNVDQESSDEDYEDPVPTVRNTAARKAERMEQAPKVEQKKRTERKKRFSSLAVLTKPGTPRSPVRVPSGSKPLETTPVPAVANPNSVKEEGTGFALIWGKQRRRSKRSKPLAPRIVTDFKSASTARNKLQYKLHKMDSNTKSREPSPTETESLPAEVENTKSRETSPTETEALPSEVENTKSREPSPIETEALPAEVENTKSRETSPTETEALPAEVENTKSRETSPTETEALPSEVENTKSREPSPIETEALPAEVENTETREPAAAMEIEDLPPGLELLIRNKWEYKLQKMENTKQCEPSPTVDNFDDLEMLASTVVAELV